MHYGYSTGYYGFLCVVLGVLGSILPALPGPPISWVGLLLLYLTDTVATNWWFLGITLAVVIIVSVLDYTIPIAGTKRFGGSKAGMIGTTIGLVVALFVPIFGLFGIIIWPFIGALVGELIKKSDSKNALKAAFGSFLGFVASTMLKFIVSIVYLGFFIKTTIQHGSSWF